MEFIYIVVVVIIILLLFLLSIHSTEQYADGPSDLSCARCGNRIQFAQVYASPDHTAGLGWL